MGSVRKGESQEQDQARGRSRGRRVRARVYHGPAIAGEELDADGLEFADSAVTYQLSQTMVDSHAPIFGGGLNTAFRAFTVSARIRPSAIVSVGFSH